MTVFGPDEQMRLRLFMANCRVSQKCFEPLATPWTASKYQSTIKYLKC